MSLISPSKVLLWLSLPMVTMRRQAELINQFGSLDDLWYDFDKFKDVAEKIVGETKLKELDRFHSEDYIDNYLAKLRQEGITVITALNPLFPKLLRAPEVDAPAVLYCRGNVDIMNTECVAVVGTRACTSYGKQMAKIVSSDLASNGVTVVSGLASGIDAYAHEAALDVGGNTIAVLGSGLNKVTPVGNAQLHDRIIENGGLIISEYKPNADANRFTFPERNRIVSGLSRGVCVIEAAEKSGALITARLALEQNREVFCVPGNVTSARSAGCNNLIFEGANFVRNGMDILSYLSIKPTATEKKEQTNAKIIVDKDQKKVYSLLEEGIKSFDGLVEKSGISPAQLSPILLSMELDDLIERDSVNTFAIKKQ